MAPGPFDELRAAYSARIEGVPALPEDRAPVVAHVGSGIPTELIDAAGLRSVRVCGDPASPMPDSDRVAEPAIDPLARAQLQRLLDGTYSGATEVWVAHDTEGSARVFHYAAECRAQGLARGEDALGEVVPVDLVRGRLPAHRADRLAVLGDLRERVGILAGRPVTDDDLVAALGRSDRRRRRLQELSDHRRARHRRVSGLEAVWAVGAAAVLTPLEHAEALGRALELVAGAPALGGTPTLLTGSGDDADRVVGELEERGLLVVGEDHDWGAAWFDHTAGDHPVGTDPLETLADRYGPRAAPRTGRAPISDRAAYTARLAIEAGAEVVVAFLRPGDDGPPWDVPAQRDLLARSGIALVPVRLGADDLVRPDAVADRIASAVAGALEQPAVHPPQPAPRPSATPTAARGGSSSGERPDDARPARAGGLEASAVATAHQRRWFAEMRRQVADGSPLAVCNADAPHEILRAMGIPYVVNQWWASVCAAKQQGPRYLEALRHLGYPDDVEAYSAMALGSAIDDDPTDAPWGGLPPVDLLVAETTTDATAKIFETWSSRTGAELVLLDATLARLRPRRWFDHIHDDWESVIGSRRLDLMVAEVRKTIRAVEARTGRRFDEEALAAVMALANEQAEWNARTRDLVARAPAAPIDVTEAIPATMIPQWHRGSEWGRDAARRLHDEVAGRVEAGESVVADERARLMWVGRGLWHDMDFYRRVRERHGAVFVWSMYLAVAADAYLRRGGDPLRTLAARFCGFADLYNTPPWSSEWYAKEARLNRIDGVVHLTTDAVRGAHFVTRAIEASGIPVLEVTGSNVDSRGWDAGGVAAAVDSFLHERVLSAAALRREAENA